MSGSAEQIIRRSGCVLGGTFFCSTRIPSSSRMCSRRWSRLWTNSEMSAWCHASLSLRMDHSTWPAAVPFPPSGTGFRRASGLSQWFPSSRLLARYNLTYLDEHQTCEVDAVNGAFMFAGREAVEEVGLLDEDYFMYCEDLDWCFRLGRSGWKVVYHPAATTVHLKGQSGNPKSSAMIRELFRSTKMFYRKNCFAEMGPIRRASILISLDIWKWATLLKNALRSNKRTRP